MLTEWINAQNMHPFTTESPKTQIARYVKIIALMYVKITPIHKIFFLSCFPEDNSGIPICLPKLTVWCSAQKIARVIYAIWKSKKYAYVERKTIINLQLHKRKIISLCKTNRWKRETHFFIFKAWTVRENTSQPRLAIHSTQIISSLFLKKKYVPFNVSKIIWKHVILILKLLI